MTDKTPNGSGPGSEIAIYQTEDGRSRIRVLLQGETIWLTQALMAELFQVTPKNVTLHLRRFYSSDSRNPTNWECGSSRIREESAMAGTNPWK